MQGTNKCWTLNEQFDFFYCTDRNNHVDTLVDVNPVTAPSCDNLNWCNNNGKCMMTGPDSGAVFQNLKNSTEIGTF